MKNIFTSKINIDTGKKEAVYSEELILDGFTAFIAMKKWMDIYFKDNYDTVLGELLGNIHFIEGGCVDRFECWELWEKVVADVLKEKSEEKKS